MRKMKGWIILGIIVLFLGGILTYVSYNQLSSRSPYPNRTVMKDPDNFNFGVDQTGLNDVLIEESNRNSTDLELITDKNSYKDNEKVRLIIDNKNKENAYVWLGHSGFILEKYDGNTWRNTQYPWSDTASCGGVMREIPAPIFSNPLSSTEIGWDCKIYWCNYGNLNSKSASGLFRFLFRYAKDQQNCRLASNQTECWLEFTDKRWLEVYSNEFSIAD